VSLDAILDLRQPGWTRRDDHGSGVASLHYADGAIRIEHSCTRPRDGMTLLVAPMLTKQGEPGGHQVTSLDPLTVSPSILCDDCGLHGFIVAGRWHS
jgi:hypothetical protein